VGLENPLFHPKPICLNLKMTAVDEERANKTPALMTQTFQANVELQFRHRARRTFVKMLVSLTAHRCEH